MIVSLLHATCLAHAILYGIYNLHYTNTLSVLYKMCRYVHKFCRIKFDIRSYNGPSVIAINRQTNTGSLL